MREAVTVIGAEIITWSEDKWNQTLEGLPTLPLRQEVRHSTLTAVYVGSNPTGVAIKI